MNKKKFKSFLDSLKGNGDESLIESIKSGFQACFESLVYDLNTVHKIEAKLNENLDATEEEALKFINDEAYVPPMALDRNDFEYASPVIFNKGFVILSFPVSGLDGNSFQFTSMSNDEWARASSGIGGGYSVSPDPEDTYNVGGERYNSWS